MIKKGFTLAEVLITLGIVGVIAAITLPTLTQSTTTAQIGPKLAKAASAFEQANKSLLKDQDVDCLTDTNLLATVSGDEKTYGDALSNYLNMSENDYHTLTGASHSSISGPPSSTGASYLAKDGIEYITYTDWGSGSNGTPAHKQIVGIVWVDINGVAKPNEYATDVFWFHLMNDGSLQPGGGTFLANNAGYTHAHWSTKCPIGGAVESDVDAAYCTGHIFENNLKVLYR